MNHPNRSKQQQATHAPGPWRIFITANGVPIITSDKGDVAVTRANGNNAGGIEGANARLIAAAPELLAALKDVIRLELGNSYTGSTPEQADTMKHARAAIAKAEGR